MEVFLNGTFLPAEKANISIFDHGFLYGDGVYETLRTVSGKVIDPEIHFERLAHSADLLRIPLHTPFSELHSVTGELVKRNAFKVGKEARIRWSLTRGVNDFDFSGARSPTLLVTAIPLPEYPMEYFQKGVAVCTLEVQRIFPHAKTISLLPLILGKQHVADTNSLECLFSENGYLTEGTVSNFFVQIGREIRTAPPEKVLPGTAAKRFTQKMSEHGFALQEKSFTVKEALSAEAAFLTNSLFGVLPVKSLDREPIGNGKIPAYFSEILKNFWI